MTIFTRIVNPVLFSLLLLILTTPVLAQNAQQEATPAPQGAAAPNDPALQAELQKAVDFFNKSDIPKALEVLNALYKARPNIMPPRLVMAQWFAQANVPNAVRASLEMATHETPNDPEAYILLGEIALRQRELTAAEVLFEKADTLLPKYTVNEERKKNMTIALYRNQATLYEMRGRWADMQRVVINLLNTAEQKPDMYRQLAVAYFQQGDDAKAKQYLENATKLPGGDVGMPVDGIMSRLYLMKGEIDKSKAALQEAINKNPTSPEVLALAVTQKLNDHDIQGAMAFAEHLVKAKPNDNETKRILATVSLYQENFAQAEKLFQEIVVASPMDAAAINGLALALCEQNDPEKLRRAMENAGNNVQKDQKNIEFLGTLGWILIKSNRMDDALKVLQQAAAGGQINSATAYYLAELSARNNNFVQAKSLLEAALRNTQPFFKRNAAQKLLQEVTPKAAEQAQKAQAAQPANQ